MLKFFRNMQEKEEVRDLADRKVSLVKTTFETVLGDEVSFIEWVRLGNYSRGIVGYKETKLINRQ